MVLIWTFSSAVLLTTVRWDGWDAMEVYDDVSDLASADAKLIANF
jgi:hypothetical protein